MSSIICASRDSLPLLQERLRLPHLSPNCFNTIASQHQTLQHLLAARHAPFGYYIPNYLCGFHDVTRLLSVHSIHSPAHFRPPACPCICPTCERPGSASPFRL